MLKKIKNIPAIRRDLESIDISGAGGLLTLFKLSDSDVGRFIKDASLNTDNLPLLEFNAPFDLYSENTVLWINQMVGPVSKR